MSCGAEPSGWRVSRRVSVQFGTGIGMGTATDAIRPIFEGLMGASTHLAALRR